MPRELSSLNPLGTDGAEMGHRGGAWGYRLSRFLPPVFAKAGRERARLWERLKYWESWVHFLCMQGGAGLESPKPAGGVSNVAPHLLCCHRGDSLTASHSDKPGDVAGAVSGDLDTSGLPHPEGLGWPVDMEHSGD